MSTTPFRFGHVVLMPVPYTNQSGHKQRPAVIISSPAYNSRRPDVVVLPITSQILPTLYFGEVLLQDWNAAGLPKPSVVKPNFFTLEKSLIIKTLGQLSQKDHDALLAAIAPLLRP